MLAECIALHEHALFASFVAEYQSPVEAFDAIEASNLAAWLPPGSALWRSVGGPMSLTEGEHILRVVDYRLQVLAWLQTEDAKHKRNQPKPPRPVQYSGAASKIDEHASMQAKARARREKPTP